MSRIPKEVASLLVELTAMLPQIIGKNLAGIYLYGSLTQQSFNPKRSDIDCIVVTYRDLSNTQFKALGEWFERMAKTNPWTTRLQISFLIRNQILRMNAKACLYQFGKLTRSGSDGNPIIWINVLQTGVVLLGPNPETFVPPITRGRLFKALAREVRYLREEITNPKSEWRDVPLYRVYAVLTLCRILYSFHTEEIVSKQTAAKWVLRNIPNKWGDVIKLALKANDKKSDPRIPLVAIRQFTAFVQRTLTTQR